MFLAALCAGLTWIGGYEFAQQCGWPAALAWILPLITDVYAGVALWIMLGLSWASSETRHFAAASTVFAVAESVAMQVMYHILLHTKIHTAPVGVVIAVAVVAPVMLALTVHLMARVNADRSKLVRAAQQAQARHAEAQRLAAAEHAEAERAEAARIAADRAAADRAEAERAAAAAAAEADQAATRRAEAEAAAARRAAADGPPMGHPGDVAHGPDTAGGPSAGDVAHGPHGQMAHGPDGVDHAADGPPLPGVAPEHQPYEPESPAAIPDADERDKAAARNAYRKSCREGKPIAERPLGEQFGHQRNWGKYRIKEVRQGVHLAAASGQ